MYIAFFIYGTVAVMILPSETLSRSGINKQKMLRARALHKTLFSRALYLHERHAVARRIDALASFFHVQAPVLKDELKERESGIKKERGKREKNKKKKERSSQKSSLLAPFASARAHFSHSGISKKRSGPRKISKNCPNQREQKSTQKREERAREKKVSKTNFRLA